MTQLTRDHSVTAELVQRGELREADASRHPHYWVLIRALGVALTSRSTAELSLLSRGIASSSVVTVCSTKCRASNIVGVMAEGEDVAGVADRLVGQAISQGGRETVSVVVAEMAA